MSTQQLEVDTVPGRPTVRMMVLETDEPHPETKSRRGTFGDILHHHFAKAGDDHDPPLGIETDTRYVITEKGGTMPKAHEFDNCEALLITGSVYGAHGNDPWILDLLALLKELWLEHPNMHFSGVCFGHQLLCRLLGSEIASAAPTDWELGHSKINLSPLGQELFQTDKPEVYLHQMHQDYVVAPPTAESSGGLLSPGTKVEVWGHSEHTKVQGVYIKGRLFTTQAHLAFDEGMVKRQIQMRVDSGSIEDLEHADRAAETAELDHDGDVAAAAILRFFHDEGVE
ncbi:class I glutamine amidotransferase-like protein [Chaetomium sp. MPI-CAGE-AT-0009]|nr:class I glutamine amidotransferase-like protein [Chaetomium sp. MPI-CAGE-AT-0009]